MTTAAYDDRIAEWLGQWEDATVAVIAGWVARAAAARTAAHCWRRAVGPPDRRRGGARRLRRRRGSFRVRPARPARLRRLALRLAQHLRYVLDELGKDGQAAGQFPAAASPLEDIRLVLACFDWEHDDRQFALEQIDDILRRSE